MYRQRMKTILVDLLVVFTGVYAAFMLDDFRKQQEIENKRQQIVDALLTDLKATQEGLDKGVPQIKSIFDGFLEKYKNGEAPGINHLGFDVAFRSGMWEAMLQSSGVDVLEVDFILQMEAYYENLEAFRAKMEYFRDLSARQIVPNLGKDSTFFYEPESKTLREPYRWYLSAVVAFTQGMTEIQERNRALVEKLTQLSTIE